MIKTRGDWVRKMWHSMMTIHPRDDARGVAVGMEGEFEKLPKEVLVEIVKRVGPQGVARMCCLNRSWCSFLSSDNSIWIHFLISSTPSLSASLGDPIFFSETQLRCGYPLPFSSMSATNFINNSSLSFMRIYSQRAQVPGSLVVDSGSGYCKFGWSKYPYPSGRSATFLEFGNIESPSYARHRNYFATIYNRMQVKAYMHPVVLSLPLCHYDDTENAKSLRVQLKDAIYSALFDMNVPAVCAINQAVLALFAAQRTSGIVVNIGFQATSVVPILHGKVKRDIGVVVSSMGALKITGFLREQMQQNDINFGSLYTVRTLKENLCYVAADYAAELSKDTEASFEIHGAGRFTLSKERFQAGEILFQPHLAGVNTKSLHQAVAECMENCLASSRPDGRSWFQTVVLCGGSACLPGLAERLEKELRAMESLACHGVKVIPPPYGVDTVWYGAKLISNLSTFPESWCVTKKNYRRKNRYRMPFT